jgi:hypothetical protein
VGSLLRRSARHPTTSLGLDPRGRVLPGRAPSRPAPVRASPEDPGHPLEVRRSLGRSERHTPTVGSRAPTRPRPHARWGQRPTSPRGCGRSLPETARASIHFPAPGWSRLLQWPGTS